ncbi:MAG: hypothetical protein PHI73_04440 [Patescibacteria group bacterium]|nr:hypothetical protein [Patescibacteria group bacterium]
MKHALKIFGYGFLLFIITMVLLFLLSMITGSDSPVGFWWVGVVLAIIMTATSFWFSRGLHPATAKQAFSLGLTWAIMLAGFLLVIAIPNGTTDIVFGNWSTYLVFVGVAVGPVFMKPRPVAPNTKMQ